MRAALPLSLLLVVVPARAAWMVPPAPYSAKDFTVVKRDGWFHCFYIRRDTSVPDDSTQRDLGHAVSPDMYIWTQLPPVLPVRPDEWDNARIWAPHIVELDNVYYLFYTGVTEQPGSYAFHQRIGLATSTDLMTWNRLDEPVLSCAEVRWAYCDPLLYGGGEFRDPFVMPNVHGAGWVMFYTARPVSSPATYVAGTAISAGDLTRWVNGYPLWITQWFWSGTPQVESPHVFLHDGLYYLLFTGDGDQPLRLVTGTDPVGDPSTWTHRGTLGAMLGADTKFWFASEHLVDGTHEYLCFVNFDRVDFRELIGGSSWQFTLAQPPLFHVQSMHWSAPEVTVGQPVQLQFDAVNSFGRHAVLEAVEVDPDGSEQPIPLSEIGLPDSIAMTGTHTEYTWLATNWPDPEEADSTAEIVVRLTDRTAATLPIRVDRFPWVEFRWPGPGDGNPRVPRDVVASGRADSPPGFRALGRSPVGGAALLIDLSEATPVRLDLYDLRGRRVRNLVDRTLPSGATVIPWDGREESGVPAGRGIYFARLVTPKTERAIRVLLAP